MATKRVGWSGGKAATTSERRAPAHWLIVLHPSMQRNSVIIVRRGNDLISSSVSTRAPPRVPWIVRRHAAGSLFAERPRPPFTRARVMRDGGYVGLRRALL